MHGLEILHKCGKKVETISQKILVSNPYAYRRYNGKTGSGGLFYRGDRIYSKLS